MKLEKEQAYIAKCRKCGSNLLTRIVPMPVKGAMSLMLRNRAQLFCPTCNKSTNLINEYKKQKEAAKKQRAQI